MRLDINDNEIYSKSVFIPYNINNNIVITMGSDTHLPLYPLSANQRPVLRSCDHPRPISSRRKCLGRCVALTGRKWALSLSLRPCSNEWCHMSAVTCCSFIATTQAEHHERVPGLSQHREHIIIIIIIIMITGPHLHTLIIMWTLVHTALNRILHS